MDSLGKNPLNLHAALRGHHFHRLYKHVPIQGPLEKGIWEDFQQRYPGRVPDIYIEEVPYHWSQKHTPERKTETTFCVSPRKAHAWVARNLCGETLYRVDESGAYILANNMNYSLQTLGHIYRRENVVDLLRYAITLLSRDISTSKRYYTLRKEFEKVFEGTQNRLSYDALNVMKNDLFFTEEIVEGFHILEQDIKNASGWEGITLYEHLDRMSKIRTRWDLPRVDYYTRFSEYLYQTFTGKEHE